VLVFLHGVPETAAIWDKVRAAVGGESVALALPGFGCARPPGFAATKDAYVDWVLRELDQFGDPVDLVGHDWGAGFTYRIATAHGDRLRSWAIDVARIFHPDYEWHEFAKIWQTPGDGEAFFENQAAVPLDARAAALESFGVAHDDALVMASWSDETMAGCILDLYRSAMPNPYADWGDAGGSAPAPGLVIHPTDDPFDERTKSQEVARSLGARHATLEHAGHFWPFEAADAAAEVLAKFLASVP
jgi:pimeloyl-ACP methyl ester carboxylesterase